MVVTVATRLTSEDEFKLARDLTVRRHPGTKAPNQHRDIRVFWNRNVQTVPARLASGKRQQKKRVTDCHSAAHGRSIALSRSVVGA